MLHRSFRLGIQHFRSGSLEALAPVPGRGFAAACAGAA
jgi:hypothetical protein